MKKLTNAIDKAMREYASWLESEAIKATLQLSRRYPSRVIVFCSAMGSWSWNTDDREFRDLQPKRAMRLFDDAFSAYQWNALPAPVRIKAQNGALIEHITDW